MRHACTIFCLALSLLLGACKEDKAQSLTGVYQTSFENGILVPGDISCASPYKIIDGQCIEPYTSTDTLGFFQETNGDLFFAANLSFSNGHSCTIDGMAKKETDGGGWIFENENCKLLIKLNSEKITFDVPQNHDCGHYCGARGNLSGAEFPLSSKVKHTLKTKDDLACVSSLEETCPWDQSQKEPK